MRKPEIHGRTTRHCTTRTWICSNTAFPSVFPLMSHRFFPIKYELRAWPLMFLPKNCLYFTTDLVRRNQTSLAAYTFNSIYFSSGNQINCQFQRNCKMLTLADYTVISLVSGSLLFVVVRNLLTLTRATLMI